MSRRTSRQMEALPEIPDFPNSPLPAWKHYGILRVLESKFHKELKRKGYTGHLVGLDVTYTVGPDTYTMGFGYSFEKRPEPLTTSEDPFSDDFVERMFDFASDLISQHISFEGSNFNLELSASVNQQVNTTRVKCQAANAANCGKPECNGKCRKFKQRNDGSWECTHKKGNCNTC